MSSLSIAATILIVDDESHNRKLLQTLLAPEGYSTLVAATGAEGLQLAAEKSPDLILLDVMMPEINGYQVAALLKTDPATRHIPIIMVTALDDRTARLACLAAGAEEFLTKPVERAELYLRVRNLLRLKSYSDFLLNHSRILEEQVLARTQELQRFRTAMDATAEAIVLVSHQNMKIIDVNATACTMLGYSREELLETAPASLSTATEDQLKVIYAALIAGVDPRGVRQTKVRRKDGSWVQVDKHRHILQSGSDWIIVTVMRDITERTAAQDEILRLNAGLEDCVRQRTLQLLTANQELEAFSYSVSHDLRTPLSTINGFSALLSKEMGSSTATERSHHYLSRIQAGVGQMSELIDTLLALALVSRTGMHTDEVDLSAMAHEVLAGYQERDPHRVVVCNVQEGLLAKADARLMRQVLDNLLGNAWKFSGRQARGLISFGCQKTPTDETVYTVQDNGAGFDMAYADKLFSAFQRLHTAEQFAGTGIGLATVSRIIKRHGGEVWGESTLNQGATFSFTLGKPYD